MLFLTIHPLIVPSIHLICWISVMKSPDLSYKIANSCLVCETATHRKGHTILTHGLTETVIQSHPSCHGFRISIVTINVLPVTLQLVFPWLPHFQGYDTAWLVSNVTTQGCHDFRRRFIIGCRVSRVPMVGIDFFGDITTGFPWLPDFLGCTRAVLVTSQRSLPR